MPDTTSTYRVLRLVLHVPHTGHLAHWSLFAVGVKRGIPDARVLQTGICPFNGAPNPTEEEIWEALDHVVGQHMIAR